MREIHSIWYRSVLKEDGTLWCESSLPDQVVRMSDDQDVIFQKLIYYIEHDGWESWTP